MASTEPAPAPFLILDSTHPNQPADVTNDAAWTKILTAEKFNQHSLHVLGTGTNPDDYLEITYSSDLGDLTFSSIHNNDIFQERLSTDSLRNTAWVGDSLNSAVTLLSGGPAGPLPLQGAATTGANGVLETFGIDPPNFSSEFASFLGSIDATKVLTVTLLTQDQSNLPVSALWCIANTVSYQTAVNLSFKLSTGDILGKAINWATTQLGIPIKQLPSIPNLFLSVRKTASYDLTGTKTSLANSFSLQFPIPGGFDCSIDFLATGTTVLLRPITVPNPSIFSAIGQALDTVVGLDESQMPSGSGDFFSEFFQDFDLWYVQVQNDPNSASATPALLWKVALLVSFKVNDIPLIISLTYDSGKASFTGDLMLQSNIPSGIDQRLPSYDRRLAFPQSMLTRLNITLDDVPPSIDLWQLILGQGGDHGSPPSNIPTTLTAAEISYANVSDLRSVFTIFVSIATVAKPTSGNDEAPAGFVWNGISVLATIAKNKTQAGSSDSKVSTYLQLLTAMTLTAETDGSVSSARLDLALDYSSGGQWSLYGSIRNLSVALLADYFDDDSRTGAMEVLGKLNLSELEMYYSYDSGKASSFLISATLELGQLELDLSYQYVSASHDPSTPTAAAQTWGNSPPPGVKVLTGSSNSNQQPGGAGTGTKTSQWAFEAYLHADAANADIASIAESISPGARNILPPFVGGITISLDQNLAPVKLRYSRDETGGSVLVFWLSVGPFNLTFVQFRTPGVKPTVKRLLRISVDQIPLLDHVPLVNQLPQPFDHLLYLWVDDPDQTDPNLRGFTYGMIGDSSATSSGQSVSPKINVNSELSNLSIPPIQVKAKTGAKDTDLVLQAGHHFVIVSNGKVVLDHLFVPTPTTGHGGNTTTGSTNGSTTKELPVTKGDTDTKAGPLTISGLTLQYKDNSLLIGVDATLVLGPLTFAVEGFVLAVKLGDVTLNDLSALITKKLIEVSIQGLDAGISKPPLTIKGAFTHDKDVLTNGDSVESFRGGVSVGIKAWNLLAIGEYKIVTPAVGSQYKSVFVYGKLDGPLVELEFATIEGVRVGFGFNSMVYLPQADQLYNFPFISDSCVAQAGNDPMKVLDLLLKPAVGTPYVYSKEGGVWFCAGMTIACFDCIKLTAVMMFEIDTNKDGVIIALLADGIFQMEPDSPDPDLTLFYVELLIKVEINFVEGYIAADAALAPTSHVYVPQARLTGSGSFYTWFAPNSNAGDWVISIGGYHRAFSIPAHYPKPMRLGLSFIIGDMIHVVGEAYAAVTPKCAMAGGHLHMSLDVGPVSAYCDIALDVFINFKPFYFVAGISLSVGVECDIDLLFVTIHISVSIGADLDVWGPKAFGGLAQVHFWFFSFGIRFGDSLNANETGIPLIDFYATVLKAGPAADAPASDTISTANPCISQHKISLEAGLFPSVTKTASATSDFPNTGTMTEWLVQASTLQIRIDCSFALSQAAIVVDENARTSDIPVLREDGTTDPIPDIFSFPMHNTVGIDSHLELRIYSLDGPTPVLQTGWRAVLVFKEGSTALWRKYDIAYDPLFTPNPMPLCDPANPTVTLCQAVRILPPLPLMGYSPIVDFDATKAMVAPFHETYPSLPAAQTNFEAAPFEASVTSGPTRWTDFGSVLSGKGGNSTTSDGISKAEIRGDAAPGTGLLGMCASALGWDLRPSAEKVKGVIVSKSSDGRQEWELKGAPPQKLADQLGSYYPDLPMLVEAVAAAP